MLKYKCDYSYTARNYGVSTIGKQISILQPFARQLSVIEEYRLNEIKRKDKMQASLRPNYIGFYHRKDYCNLNENLQTITMTVSNYEPRCVNNTYIIINLKIK